MSQRPNILFLFSDEHSFRYLSHRPRDRGGEPANTPTLSGLAHTGVEFDAAYCQMPLCTPSRISMLCGRHSHRCGAWTNSSVLRPEFPTFAQALADNGYATCAVGKMHLGGTRQFVGFQHRPYGDMGGPCGHQFDPPHTKHTPRAGMDMRSRTADAGVTQIPESLLQEQMVVRESVAWLREHAHRQPDQPWLLFASFSRPHFPLTAPRRHFERYWPEGVTPPCVGPTGDTIDHPMTRGMRKGFRVDEIDDEEMMRARAAYFACVDYLDEILGDFLTILERDGLLDNTIIIYTADHGELAGEHGLWWKNSWHEGCTRVPLLFQTPDQRRHESPPRLVSTPVSLADIFPTLCGLTGTEAPDELDGIDLAPVIRGEVAEPGPRSQPVICEALPPRWGEGTQFRMVRDGRYKYVAFADAPELLFDLHDDPHEQRNLAPTADDSLLESMRRAALDGFDWQAVEAARRRDHERDRADTLPLQFRTPNQIFLPDGRLVEADTPLYSPEVVTDQPQRVFVDWPDSKS